MEPQSPDPALPDEVAGLLAFDGSRKSGAYGAYWNVIVTIDGCGQSIRANLSENLWVRTGLALPEPTTTIRATARRNPSGRWNIASIDGGARELTCAWATITDHALVATETVARDRADAAQAEPRASAPAVYQITLRPESGASLQIQVPARMFESFGIVVLPVGYSFLSDWTRESRGWKLTGIGDLSLRALFPDDPEALPLASGHLETNWSFDDGSSDTTINFVTGIDGVLLRCRLFAATLRAAGNRSVATTATVRARLNLRDGRWRIAELLEPRPDLIAGSGRDILFSVKARLALREPNRFGDLVNWLDILDKDVEIGVASLAQARLSDIDEDDLAPGARIVCDLKRGKWGWYASRIHRVADQATANSQLPPGRAKHDSRC